VPIHRLPAFAATISTFATLACGGGDLALPSSIEPALIEIADGDGQEGTVGRPLRNPLVVRLMDELGNGAPNQSVTWVVSTGGGSVNPEMGTTDEDGLASTEWTLGPSPGPNTVSAVVAGVGGVTFRAVAAEGDGDGGGGGGGSTIEPVEGEDQRAPVGSTVPIRPAVRVTDTSGRPVEGVQVSFGVTGGGGSVNGADRTTGSDGIARVGSWRLGPEPGTNTLEARADGLQGSPVIFAAEATPSGGVDRFVFRTQPPDLTKDEAFSVEVALVDADGNTVPLSGVVIYLGLFRDGKDKPSNQEFDGERFREARDGVAVFSDLRVKKEGNGYRLRALSDDFPEVGPTFSDRFDVEKD
jgi:hypothetical protein